MSNKGVWLNDAGTWRQSKQLYLNDNGVWRLAKVVWMQDAGVWRQVYPPLLAPFNIVITCPNALLVANRLARVTLSGFTIGGSSNAFAQVQYSNIGITASYGGTRGSYLVFGGTVAPASMVVLVDTARAAGAWSGWLDFAFSITLRCQDLSAGATISLTIYNQNFDFIVGTDIFNLTDLVKTVTVDPNGRVALS